MKRLLILGIGIFFGLFAQAQFPTQRVLVEVGTGTWCPACPTAVNIIELLQSNGYPVAVVKYHALQDDPFENEASLERIDFYAISSYPTIFVDGTVVSPWNSYAAAETLVTASESVQKDYQIDLTADWLSDDALSVSGTIERMDGVNEELNYFVVVTESEIDYSWQNLNEVNHTTRAVLPNKSGAELNFEGSNRFVFNQDIQLSDDWNKDNLEVVVFIQDIESKEVKQSNAFSMHQVGIVEQEMVMDIKIFPNPAKEWLMIHSEEVPERVQLLSFDGKILLNQDNAQKIHTAAFPSGVYLLQIFLPSGIYQQKVIILDSFL